MAEVSDKYTGLMESGKDSPSSQEECYEIHPWYYAFTPGSFHQERTHKELRYFKLLPVSLPRCLYHDNYSLVLLNLSW